MSQSYLSTLENCNPSTLNITRKIIEKLLNGSDVNQDELDFLAQNCAYYPIVYRLIGTIFYMLIGSSGIIGNLMVIYIIIAFKSIKSMHKPRGYYLSLALADLLVLLSTVPAELANLWIINDKQVYDEMRCKITIYIQFMSINCSATNIAFFTYERYKAVSRPLETRQNLNKKLNSINCHLITIWLFNLIWNLPWFFITALIEDSKTKLFTCSFKHERKSVTYLVLFFLDLVIFYVVPLFFSAYNYIKIYQNLAKRLTFPGTTFEPNDTQFNSNNQHSIINPIITLPGSSRSSNNLNEQVTEDYESGEIVDSGIDQNSNYNLDWVRQRSQKNRSRLGSYCFGEENSINRNSSLNHRENFFKKASINVPTRHCMGGSLRSSSAGSFNKDSVIPKNSIASNNRRRFRRATTDQQNRQVVKILFLIFILFAILLLPYRSLLVYNSLFKEQLLNIWLLFICKGLCTINSMINPILYNAYSHEFREHFKETLKKLFCFNCKSNLVNLKKSKPRPSSRA